MTQGILYANIIISGIINGSLITFIAAFVKNYSQKKHFGKVLGMLYSAVGFGKLLLSDFIFPSFSESFKKNEETCQGKQCFIYSFLLNALFNLIILIYLIVVIILNKKKKKQQNKKQQSHNNGDTQSQKNENSTS
jgi:large-conductance mechanosensitive channel